MPCAITKQVWQKLWNFLDFAKNEIATLSFRTDCLNSTHSGPHGRVSLDEINVRNFELDLECDAPQRCRVKGAPVSARVFVGVGTP